MTRRAVESRFEYNVPQPCTVKIQILHNVFACQNPNYFRRKRSCGKVMLLHLSVSHSVHSGRGLPTHPCRQTWGEGLGRPRGCRPPWMQTFPGYVNKWAVRILLECIPVLVLHYFNFFFIIFVVHMSIFGATDTPVLDFW